MPDKVRSVDDFLEMLEPPQRAQVVDLRRIILTTAPQLIEHIKWNSPSYVQDGIDRLTINARNKENAVQLILHMDTARAENRKAPPAMTDETGLVRWVSDIRGVIPLAADDAVDDIRNDLTSVIRRWLDTR